MRMNYANFEKLCSIQHPKLKKNNACQVQSRIKSHFQFLALRHLSSGSNTFIDKIIIISTKLPLYAQMCIVGKLETEMPKRVQINRNQFSIFVIVEERELYNISTKTSTLTIFLSGKLYYVGSRLAQRRQKSNVCISS